MKKLNNLIEDDVKSFERQGEEIENIKSLKLQRYINGLVQMSMADLNFTDKQIDDVVMNIASRYNNDRPADVLIWEWTHMTE